MSDLLIDTGISSSPTTLQVKALFMMLPDTIIGSAISWGLDDTEVRDSIYVFVDENRAEVQERIASKG